MPLVDWQSPVAIEPLFSCQRKPSNEFMCEPRKQIVARAHDYDAITTTGQSDQGVATSDAVWESKGLSTMPFNVANNFAASDAAVDRAAEIYGLGHDQYVLIVQSARKAVHQGVPHQTNRAVAMGLKHQQQAAGKRVHGFERGRYLVGIMGKVVDHGYSICRAHDLQSPPDAAELTQMGRSLRQCNAACLRDTQGGKCVGHIMQPGNLAAPPRRSHRYRAPSLGTRSRSATGPGKRRGDRLA